MRHFFLILACAGTAWLSYSQAQSKLSEDTPLPAGPARGHTKLMIDFAEPLEIPASQLNRAPLKQVLAEARGVFAFARGRMVNAGQARRLEAFGPVCEVAFSGEFAVNGPANSKLKFRDLELGGRHFVSQVDYESEWRVRLSSKRRLRQFVSRAVIQLELRDFEINSPSVRAITVTRVNPQDAGEITPRTLKDCFGENVSVVEVPAGR